MEKGLIYGLKDYASVDEMHIDENSDFVFHSAATAAGKMITHHGSSATSTSYTMTMIQNIENMSVAGLKAVYYVRGYAKLSDGTCVYSPVNTYSIFQVASILYNEQYMRSEEQHNYLYNNILKVADESYESVEYKPTFICP